MAQLNDTLNVDIDPATGATLSGWPAVAQSVREGILTSFGERIMREYFGTLVPQALGRNMGPDTLLGITASIAAFLSVFEPRYRVTRAVPVSVTRLGELSIEIEGEYMPRALLDDDTVEGLRRVVLTIGG